MEKHDYAGALINRSDGGEVWGCTSTLSQTFSFLRCTEGVGSQGWSSTTLLQVSNMISFSFIASHQGGSFPVAFKAAANRRRKRSEGCRLPGMRRFQTFFTSGHSDTRDCKQESFRRQSGQNMTWQTNKKIFEVAGENVRRSSSQQRLVKLTEAQINYFQASKMWTLLIFRGHCPH